MRFSPNIASLRARRRLFGRMAGACLGALLLAGVAAAAPVEDKDQSRLLPSGGKKVHDKLIPGVPLGGEDPALGEDAVEEGGPLPGEGAGEEDLGPSLEELIAEDIPDVEAVDYTLDQARRALDVLAEVYGKFEDSEIEKYPTLQEFAEKSPRGGKLKEIVRKHGFKSVKEWSNIIANIGFAYSSLQEGDEELLRQLEEVKADTKMDKERKARLLRYYDALIPSENNKRVLRELMEDKAYVAKLHLLEGHQHGEDEGEAGEMEPEEGYEGAPESAEEPAGDEPATTPGAKDRQQGKEQNKEPRKAK